MEISDVRKRLREAMERAKRGAAERRARTDQTARSFDVWLERVAIPLFRQIANVLKADGYQFSLSTPSGSVRLMSDRSGDDYVEVLLDSTGDRPRVVGRARRSRGRQVSESEGVVGTGDPETITEDDLFAFLLKEIEPFVER
jgi:hypothetical protein